VNLSDIEVVAHTPADPTHRLARLQAIHALQEKERRKRERKFTELYPAEGPLRRELYPKHMHALEMTGTARQLAVLGANRIGKTYSVGLYFIVAAATGWYPDWWRGRVFAKPLRIWVAGRTNQTVREIIQDKLLGQPGSWGTGLLPAECIHRVVRSGGATDAVESIYIKHKDGYLNHIMLKSYEQGAGAFEGTEQDVILLDEEPSLAIYTECLLRTMTCNGIVMLTFTPLQGISEVVQQFFPGGDVGYYDNLFGVDADHTGMYGLCIGWDDVPHLSEAAKVEYSKTIPPFQRDARTKGWPRLGAGAIYPIPESEILVEPFAIPKTWPHAYGLDVGWKVTAAVFGAQSPSDGIWYLYSEHYQEHAEPSVHAAAINARGKRMPGCIDPASRGRGQRDGVQLIQQYCDLGLNLQIANNSVFTGLTETWELYAEGRLKVFSILQHFRAEFRVYQRDEKGNVVKKNDHLMDAKRYFVMTGRNIAAPLTALPDKQKRERNSGAASRETGWMAR